MQVINIEPDERRIGLSIKALLPIDKKMLEQLKRDREEEEAEKVQREQEKESKGSKEKEEKEESKESEGVFVASKTGKKYYPADSASAKRIKKENRIEFATQAEAKKAGYSA